MHLVSIALPDPVVTRRLQLACQQVASTSSAEIAYASRTARVRGACSETSCRPLLSLLASVMIHGSPKPTLRTSAQLLTSAGGEPTFPCPARLESAGSDRLLRPGLPLDLHAAVIPTAT